MDGTVRVAGLSAPIEIVRDADAIPHIFAANKLDALFGLGYVHAQDRLWQMEFQRRIGFGRLSEDPRRGGAAAGSVSADRRLRPRRAGRLGAAAAADQTARSTPTSPASTRFSTTHHGSALPPEFTLLRFEPELWTGADVVVWQKMMAWDLSANYSFELLRHDIAARVGLPGLQELMPDYAKTRLSITGDGEQQAR